MVFLKTVKSDTQKKLNSSAAIGCISVRAIEVPHVIEAGKLAMRAWLKLNRAGYGVQPYSALSLLSFYKKAGVNIEGVPDTFWQSIHQGFGVMQRLFGLASSEIPLWLFRTGISSPMPDKVRTLRLKFIDIFSIKEP